MSERVFNYSMNAVLTVLVLGMIWFAADGRGFAREVRDRFVGLHSSMIQGIESARYWRELDEMIERIAQENTERTRETNRGLAFGNI